MTDDASLTTDDAAPTPADYAAVSAQFEADAAGDSGDAATDSGNHEAAKWRVRLRESEAALAASVDRLTMYQRRDVERLAGHSLSRADDVWLSGVETLDLLEDDDSGLVSEVKVKAAVEKVLEGRPQLGRGFPDMGGGSRGGSVPTGADWSKVLRGQT